MIEVNVRENVMRSDSCYCTCEQSYRLSDPDTSSTISMITGAKSVFFHGLRVQDLQHLLIEIKARLTQIDSTRTVADNAKVNQTV